MRRAYVDGWGSGLRPHQQLRAERLKVGRAKERAVVGVVPARGLPEFRDRLHAFRRPVQPGVGQGDKPAAVQRTLLEKDGQRTLGSVELTFGRGAVQPQAAPRGLGRLWRRGLARQKPQPPHMASLPLEREAGLPGTPVDVAFRCPLHEACPHGPRLDETLLRGRGGLGSFHEHRMRGSRPAQPSLELRVQRPGGSFAPQPETLLGRTPLRGAVLLATTVLIRCEEHPVGPVPHGISLSSQGVAHFLKGDRRQRRAVQLARRQGVPHHFEQNPPVRGDSARNAFAEAFGDRREVGLDVLLPTDAGGLASPAPLRLTGPRRPALLLEWRGETRRDGSRRMGAAPEGEGTLAERSVPLLGMRRELSEEFLPVNIRRAHLESFQQEVAQYILCMLSQCLASQRPRLRGRRAKCRVANECGGSAASSAAPPFDVLVPGRADEGSSTDPGKAAQVSRDTPRPPSRGRSLLSLDRATPCPLRRAPYARTRCSVPGRCKGKCGDFESP